MKVVQADAQRMAVNRGERDAWIEPVIRLLSIQRSERLAVTVACIALAGDSYKESAARLDRCIEVTVEALELWRAERGPRRKQSQKEQIAARTLGILQTTRADLEQVEKQCA